MFSFTNKEVQVGVGSSEVQCSNYMEKSEVIQKVKFSLHSSENIKLYKRELICLLMFTCNYVVTVWRGFLFLWVLGMGYVILLWHSLSLPYNYFIFSLVKI